MILKERLQKDFDAMAQLTGLGEGVNRLAFTDADWEGRQYMDLVMLSVIRLVQILIYQL